MRIALVAQDTRLLSPWAAADSGDQAVRVSSLAGALARAGHRVTIYSPEDAAVPAGSTDPAAPVTMEHIPAGPPGRLAPGKLAPLSRLGGYLGERWRWDAPDVVHAQFWTCGMAALAGARGLGVPVLQTFGSLGTAERRHRLPGQVPAARIRVEASISHRATVMLASSSEEVSELTGLGVPRSMVRVVPCGIDTTRFSLHGQVAPRGRRPRLLAAGSRSSWRVTSPGAAPIQLLDAGCCGRTPSSTKP